MGTGQDTWRGGVSDRQLQLISYQLNATYPQPSEITGTEASEGGLAAAELMGHELEQNGHEHGTDTSCLGLT